MIASSSLSALNAAAEPVLSAAGQGGGGGSSQFLLFGFMLLLIVGMFWFSSRTRRKQQQKVKDQQATMEPGTEVMTSYGLYGRLVSKDPEGSKAVIEIAPGTKVTVHLQTLTNVVQPAASADSTAAAGSAPVSGAAASDTTASSGGATAAPVDETPAGDPTDPRDPGAQPQR